MSRSEHEIALLKGIKDDLLKEIKDDLRDVRIRLRYAIDMIEHSTWAQTVTRWGDRAEWRDDDDRRDTVLHELKSIYHHLGGPKL